MIGASGAALACAAISQFGGKIERPPNSNKVRLRTYTTGNLFLQGDEGRAKNLAEFSREVVNLTSATVSPCTRSVPTS